ncbi:MAG: MerR family DNA-binding transcriptional regulator [Actinomycetales bacterium]|nr:MerR family DNA-binding transcriptional regulator [Actinomycetales bacterium]
MYTIRRAADLTGIPVATLRAWERRYGVVTPQRTESGYRLYDEPALRALAMMRDLVAEGWSPRQAAAEVERRLATDPATEPLTTLTGPAATAPTVTPPRDGDTPSSPDLVTAAAALDAAGLAELLDERFSRGTFETVVDGWLMPALRELGTAWAAGRVSVAGEHLASHAVQRRLSAAFEAAAHNPFGPDVVVGLPPGARHELGVLAFATAARRAGLAVTYLGADLPVADWSTALAAHRARCAVLSLPRAEDLPGLEAVVAAVRATDPAVRVAVGGRFQHLAPSGVERLGHDIAAAATRVATELRPS